MIKLLQIEGFQYAQTRYLPYRHGKCDFVVYELEQGVAVVVYAQPIGDYHGASVTNAAEDIATAIMGLPEMKNISVGKVVWIEHYPPKDRRETINLVMFEWHGRVARFPVWILVDRDWVERLILDSLDPDMPDAPPEICPICGGALLPDEEYMQDKFGPDWRDLPWPDWTFWCESCGEAGPWAELEDIAKHGYGEKS